jgi:energy-coupling factor transport system substrate-specific component
VDRRQANTDGGFNFATRGGPSGIDDTAAALQALARRRAEDDQGGARRCELLTRHQNADGGFARPARAGLQRAVDRLGDPGPAGGGRNPHSVKPRGRARSVAYLRSLTAANGEVRYSRTSRQTPVWVTAQAVMALAGKPLPIARAVVTRSAARPSRPPDIGFRVP